MGMHNLKMAVSEEALHSSRTAHKIANFIIFIPRETYPILRLPPFEGLKLLWDPM